MAQEIDEVQKQMAASHEYFTRRGNTPTCPLPPSHFSGNMRPPKSRAVRKIATVAWPAIGPPRTFLAAGRWCAPLRERSLTITSEPDKGSR